MSINEQVKELREFVKHFWITESRDYDVKEKINQATDTIEYLSAKLADMERLKINYDNWIYCKNEKNLPKKNDLYLVTLKNKEDGFYINETLHYIDGWDMVAIEEEFEVIAWQPLPEPYHEP